MSAAESIHYLKSIRTRLELLYDLVEDDCRVREALSDEVDWINAELERLNTKKDPGAVALDSRTRRYTGL